MLLFLYKKYGNPTAAIATSAESAEPHVSKVSLQLGHFRVLTSHCDVIHYAHAASLPIGFRQILEPEFAPKRAKRG